MFLLVLAHLGCPGQNPDSRKTVVCVFWPATFSRQILRKFSGWGSTHSCYQTMWICMDLDYTVKYMYVPQVYLCCTCTSKPVETRKMCCQTCRPTPLTRHNPNPSFDFSPDWQCMHTACYGSFSTDCGVGSSAVFLLSMEIHTHTHTRTHTKLKALLTPKW